MDALFCLALMGEGTDVVARVTTRYLNYRDNPPPEVLAILEEMGG